MRILVFGETGQVAQELFRSAGTGFEMVFLNRTQADLSKPEDFGAIIAHHQPDAVINAAAYTDVDGAETQEDIAYIVNGVAPAIMAKKCAELDIPFVHISTDYVFNGDGDTAFQPTDPTAPLGAYGRTKRAGEEAVVGVGGRYGVLRTSWVVSAHGKNFVKTMLRLGETRDHLTIVADQVGGPTPASDIAAACLTIADQLRDGPEKAGIYHFSGGPDVSWADFAREVFKQANLRVTVEDISTAQYPTPARRPANSRMDMSATTASFGIIRPDWRIGLSQILADINNK